MWNDCSSVLAGGLSTWQDLLCECKSHSVLCSSLHCMSIITVQILSRSLACCYSISHNSWQLLHKSACPHYCLARNIHIDIAHEYIINMYYNTCIPIAIIDHNLNNAPFLDFSFFLHEYVELFKDVRDLLSEVFQLECLLKLCIENSFSSCNVFLCLRKGTYIAKFYWEWTENNFLTFQLSTEFKNRSSSRLHLEKSNYVLPCLSMPVCSHTYRSAVSGLTVKSSFAR